MTKSGKLQRLKNTLKELKRVVVAYSGGVDSTFLLKAAYDTLGPENVLAVTALSPTYPANERKLAEKLASQMGARHVFLRTQELKDENFIANSALRCFYCKKELFGKLKILARKYKINWVVDASNLDDLKDYRPGTKAKRIFGIRSPLQEAGFRKKDIRSRAQKLGLPNWQKEAQACLASRIPYGQEIKKDRLLRVARGEKFLRRLGLKDVRLRDYDSLARIELNPADLAKVIKNRRLVIAKLKKLGYLYVTVDLEGYRTGSMNLILKQKVKGISNIKIINKVQRSHCEAGVERLTKQSL